MTKQLSKVITKYAIGQAKETQVVSKDMKIVFFDGVCNLCNSVVDFTMQNNPKKDIYFASLQSDFAIDFLAKHNFDASELNTFYFYEKGKIYNRSDAGLNLAKNLRSPYRIASILLLVPKNFRNPVYNFIAQNRYRFFGKKDTCRLPSEKERSFFL